MHFTAVQSTKDHDKKKMTINIVCVFQFFFVYFFSLFLRETPSELNSFDRNSSACTHTQTRRYTHRHRHRHRHRLRHKYTRTHKKARERSDALSLSLSPALSHSPALSLSHTHTNTHTHKNTSTHTHKHTQERGRERERAQTSDVCACVRANVRACVYIVCVRVCLYMRGVKKKKAPAQSCWVRRPQPSP